MTKQSKRRPQPGRLARLWQDYGLSIALFTLFAIFFVGHTISGWYQYAGEQLQHGSQPTVFGDDGYLWSWAEWTLQNWQSEFLELGMIVVLSSVLIHRGSAESKDGEDEIKAMLGSIEGKLDGIERSATSEKDGAAGPKPKEPAHKG